MGAHICRVYREPGEEEAIPTCLVLVVDDNLDIQSVIALILSAEGYQVTTASNGAEALHVLTQVEPACVLLDMRMPVLDGWGFARELAARQRHIPLVAMTAAQDAQAWCEQIKAGRLPAQALSAGGPAWLRRAGVWAGRHCCVLARCGQGALRSVPPAGGDRLAHNVRLAS